MANLSDAAQRAIAAAMGDMTLAWEIITTLNAVDLLSGAEAEYINGVTAGTSAAGKAVVLDSSSQIDALDVIAPSVNGTAVTSTGAELNLLDLSVVGALAKVKKISITSTPTGAEQDTTWDLPAKCAVLGVFVDVTTAEATGTTKTLDVGTLSSDSGTADGFLNGISVATTGLKKGTLASAGQTLGSLLYVDEGGTGELVPEMSIAPGSVSVTYTAGDSDWAEFRGDIYIIYIEIG